MTLGLLGRIRFENPVLSKDLRTRMRGAKAFIVQGAYVGMLAVMMGIYYLVWRLSHAAGATPMTISSDLGRGLYYMLFETQAALVALITPALTAGTITLEHEQRTYELLACTRLAPRTIVAGKLLSGWLFVVMLLTCSLPMAALCLMLGGISGGEIFWSYIMLCLFALCFGSIGILWSSLFSRTIAAVLLAYGSVMFYLIATVIAEDPTRSGTVHVFNPFVFLTGSTEPLSLSWLGSSTSIPAWLPGLITLPLAALFFATWAIARAPHFVSERAPLQRGLLATLFVLLTLLALLSQSRGGGGATSFAIIFTGVAALLVATVFFATGDRPASRPGSLVAWLLGGPRRLFSSELRGGWAFLLVLAALFVITLLLGNALAAGLLPALSIARAKHQASVWQLLSVAEAAKVFAVLAAVLLCYSALGALGAALNSRRLGIAFIVVVFVATHLVPGILWIDYGSWANGTEPSAALYSLYLAPYAALTAVGYPDLGNHLPSNLAPPAAPPLWMGTAILYFILAVAGSAVAEMAYQLRRRRDAARLQGG